VAKLVAEFLGRRLLAFADLPAINHYIMVVDAAVDPEGAKGETVEAHCDLPWGEESVRHWILSSALLRGDDGESGPALLDILAAAVWAAHLALLIVDESQDLQKSFLAGVAEEFVVGRMDLPQSFATDDD
jgi:hypothetical protein